MVPICSLDEVGASKSRIRDFKSPQCGLKNREKKENLNVSVAAGIALYQLIKNSPAIGAGR